MIIAVEEFMRMVETDIPSDELRSRLSGIETAIRKYTNNHFIVRGTEHEVEVREGKIVLSSPFFLVGDNVEIQSEEYKDKVFTITDIDGFGLIVDEPLRFEGTYIMSLVKYPKDIVMGVVNLLKWDISNREKIGVKSETISRWSVTYYDMDSNSLLGYPSSLLGFLKPYMRARF